MKKVISVLLSLVMVMSCLGVLAVAGVDGTTGICVCQNHITENCSCCVYCPQLSESAKAGCVTREDKGDGYYLIIACCESCTGLAFCDCGESNGCSCSSCKDENIEDSEASQGALLPEDVQSDIVSWFQLILGRISDAFDVFFDAIFEFLRLDEVLGRTE